MANTHTKIEWADVSWAPIRGCSRVSEGCRNCYAERIAARFSKPGQPYEGLAMMTENGPRWTGKVRLVEDALDLPLRWKKPRRIFVNSMSDLFHENVPDEFLYKIFRVMDKARQHTFMILTKRPCRMYKFIDGSCGLRNSYSPNVWFGVSVEDQKTADERIPYLLATPAALRFVSYEPALGPVDFRQALTYGHDPDKSGAPLLARMRGIDWIIFGGESGSRARPCNVQWARDARDQCKAAGVPFFMKQLGARPYDGLWTLAGHNYPTEPNYLRIIDPKGGDMSEFPKDLQVREMPNDNRRYF